MIVYASLLKINIITEGHITCSCILTHLNLTTCLKALTPVGPTLHNAFLPHTQTYWINNVLKNKIKDYSIFYIADAVAEKMF